jgi:hypothetical protein
LRKTVKKESTMYARVSRFQGAPGQLAGAAHGPVPEEVRALPGFKGAYIFGDRKSGKAMQASVEVAKRNRQQLVSSAGATEPPSIETYEVIFHP